MAVTTEGIDRAEITQFCEMDGRFMRELAWVYVRFADATEGQHYVMPASQGLTALGAEPYRTVREFVRNQPFPSHADRGNDHTPGPLAIHYYPSVSI